MLKQKIYENEDGSVHIEKNKSKLIIKIDIEIPLKSEHSAESCFNELTESIHRVLNPNYSNGRD
jgi:hypothetical protein